MRYCLDLWYLVVNVVECDRRTRPMQGTLDVSENHAVSVKVNICIWLPTHSMRQRSLRNAFGILRISELFFVRNAARFYH